MALDHFPSTIQRLVVGYAANDLDEGRRAQANAQLPAEFEGRLAPDADVAQVHAAHRALKPQSP